ncbi:phage major capsid protein [Lactococcus nasutitermitis]|uniref:Phage major capsid protein n=1 Tax=Lactococcus nasutitermitis TaxID=1652957 RepID=A0ABV9JDY9_9LACT|nr:phage major capsid protein [Lactococcus nasutitermitis]
MEYGKLPNYSAALSKYTNAVSEGADEKEQAKLYASAMEIMGSEIVEKLGEKTNEKLSTLMASKTESTLSTNEVKFFNEVTSGVGNPEVILPLEIVNQVFVELKEAHPLLDIIKFQNMGLNLRALTTDSIYGDAAVWGEVFGDIQGQLKQVFHQTDFSQNKLTAYVVIPKDALANGYDWLKTFVTIQISEAIAVALETALVQGDGKHKPVGLMKDLSKGTADADGLVTYGDKEATLDLSAMTPQNAAQVLAPALKTMAINAKGIPVSIDGHVKLLVSPADYYTVLAQFTSLNAYGVYTSTLPFGITLVSSIGVPANKSVLFVDNRYWSYMGNMTLQEFDQTLALQDLQLYTSKSFYYGKPYDNNASVVGSFNTPS